MQHAVNRFASFVVVAALAIGLTLPLVDHHWAERLPGHTHLTMDASFDPLHHRHPYQLHHDHHKAKAWGASFVALYNFDEVQVPSAFGLPYVALAALGTSLPRPPEALGALPTPAALFPESLAHSPDTPPPRVAL